MKTKYCKKLSVPRNLEKNGLKEKEVSFSVNSILKVIRNYTREAEFRSQTNQ